MWSESGNGNEYWVFWKRNHLGGNANNKGHPEEVFGPHRKKTKIHTMNTIWRKWWWVYESGGITNEGVCVGIYSWQRKKINGERNSFCSFCEGWHKSVQEVTLP